MLILKNYNYVTYFEDFLNTEEILLIEDYVETLGKEEEGMVGLSSGKEAVYKQVRDSYVKWVEYNQKMQWLWNKIGVMINDVNNWHYHLDLGACSQLQYSNYKAPGGFYGSHCDFSETIYPHRKLSFSIQLSDPDSYEGGDLLIYSSTINNPVAATRKKGSITLFLSLMVHEVTPITLGNRKSLVGWVSGPPLK